MKNNITPLEGEPLQGKTILLTGAGGGIGLEAAKVFVKLGAAVLIAEADVEKGTRAAQLLNGIAPGRAFFYPTDLSDTAQIHRLYGTVMAEHACPDILFHNAAAVTIGCVDEVSLEAWEYGYAVNLRAPLLLTRLFLPHMKERQAGTVAFVSSSGAAPHMGAYEVFKTAQVELSNTLAMELEDANVHTYTIGPGLVKTDTAMRSIEVVAAQMGMTTEAFYAMNESHILEVESAGLGFALSVLNAKTYHGQEISSIQVLNDFHMNGAQTQPQQAPAPAAAQELLQKIADTFAQQYAGWKSRNVFERQWVLRDFKKTMGMPAEAAEKEFQAMTREGSAASPAARISQEFFKRLLTYWQRQLKLLQGFEKNPDRLSEHTQIIKGWISDIERLLALIA